MGKNPPAKQATRNIEELENQVHLLQESLLKSDDRYDRLLRNLKDEYYFFSHDAEGHFTYVSPSITHILGYTPEEYIGINFETCWTPNPINEKADLHTKLSLQGIHQLPYEMEIYHKNGSYRRFKTTETPIKDAAGNVIAVEGMTRDITEKKKVEEKLEKYREHLEELVQQRTLELSNSKKKLVDIIDFLPTPTYVVDGEGIVIIWNRAMAKLFGVPEKEALGRHYRDSILPFHGKTHGFMLDNIWDAKGNVPEPGEGKISGKAWEERFLPSLGNGAGAHVWVAAAPIFDNERRLVGAIESYRDVTRIKEAERKIRESEQRLSTLMGNLPGMAYRIVKGDTWRVDFVSSGCRSLFGCEPSHFIGEDLNLLKGRIHKEDVERFIANVEKGIREKKPIQNEYRILSTSDETKWVFDRCEALFNNGGELISVEGFISDFTFYKKMERSLRDENLLLRSSMRDRIKFHDIVGNCEAMQQVYEMILKASATDDSVYVYGESGTGKELVAQAIHRSSERRDEKFVAVNCGAIPENLIESEFFGIQKGAYTGADADKKGYLESAGGGTLFLDEIGEISPGFQVKLLRAIEGGGFSPVGSRRIIRPDLRIVAASNKNLVEMLHKGEIRSDFFYRIHVIPIHLPPLRERGDDLFLLIDHFLKRYSDVDRLRTLSTGDMEMLRNHDWPGNVRELQNVLRRYVTFRGLSFMAPSEEQSAGKEPFAEEPEKNGSRVLKTAVEAFEKGYIKGVLEENQWHKTRTAKILGVSRKTLFRKMQAHGLLLGQNGSDVTQ